MEVRVLSFHRSDVCRDAGACCSSAWPIPVEPDRLIPIRRALDRGALTPVAGGATAAIVPTTDSPADAPVTIETGAPSFPAGGQYVGLDARESLPPLLRPGLLMDWDAWFEWERRSVDLLCNGQGSVDEALGRLHTAVEYVRRWRPGGHPLIDAVGEAFDAEKRFLAAHAFANWTAHLGTGLRSWFRSIEAAYALLETGFAVGDADLLLRHLAETSMLTEAWNQAERT